MGTALKRDTERHTERETEREATQLFDWSRYFSCPTDAMMRRPHQAVLVDELRGRHPLFPIDILVQVLERRRSHELLAAAENA